MRLPSAAALALAASAVLAGCLTATQPEPASTTPDSSATLQLPAGTYLTNGLGNSTVASLVPEVLAKAEGVARYTGFTTFEPTLGVTPDGALFMARSGSIVRSLDQGATWDEVFPITVGPYSHTLDNDPYVYVDPITGRVFHVPNQAAACMIVSFSDDAGDTWTTSAGCPLPVNDHQTFVTAPPRGTATLGYANIAYMCTNAVTSTNCARSLDGGLTWSPLPPAFVAVKDGCDASLGHMASSPDGILYIPKGNCGQPEVFVSEDEGLTWTKRVISADVGVFDHEVRVAVDEAGNVYAFWPGDDGLPYLSHSTDAGATWSPARMVGFPNLTGMDFPAIAAGTPGKIAFAYAGTSYPEPFSVEGDQALTAQVADPVDIADFLWFAYVGVMTDALDDNATIVTVTAGPADDPITRGQCGRTRCDGIGDFIAIQIGPDGRPWAAFADACTEECAKPDGQANNFQGTGGTDAPGFVGTLARGPALRGNATELPELPPSATGPATANGGGSSLIAVPEILRRR